MRDEGCGDCCMGDCAARDGGCAYEGGGTGCAYDGDRRSSRCTGDGAGIACDGARVVGATLRLAGAWYACVGAAGGEPRDSRVIVPPGDCREGAYDCWNDDAGGGALAGRWYDARDSRTGGALASTGADVTWLRETRTMFCCTGWRA
jgi:hypothetical protein